MSLSPLFLRDPKEITAAEYAQARVSALEEGGGVRKIDIATEESFDFGFKVTSPYGEDYFFDNEPMRDWYRWHGVTDDDVPPSLPVEVSEGGVEEVMATDRGLYVLFEEGARALFFEFYKPLWHVDRLEKARQFLAPLVKEDVKGNGVSIDFAYDSYVPGTGIPADQKILFMEGDVFVLIDPVYNLLETLAFANIYYTGLPEGYFPVQFEPLRMRGNLYPTRFALTHTFQGRHYQGVCLLLGGEIDQPCDLLFNYDSNFEDLSIAVRIGLEESAMANALQPFRNREPFVEHLFQAFDLPEGVSERPLLTRMKELVLEKALPLDPEALLKKMPEELRNFVSWRPGDKMSFKDKLREAMKASALHYFPQEGHLVAIRSDTPNTIHDLPAAALQALGLADDKRGWMMEVPEGEILFDNQVVGGELWKREKARENTFVVVFP